MNRDHLYRVEAIVLKRSDMGEADRLVTLLTPDQGKLRVVAKGVRKPSSRKSGHIELFTHSMLLVAKGRQLDIVTQASTLDAFMPLQVNLERLGYAYYLAELVDKFSEEGVENQALFELLLQSLRRLCDTSNDASLLARFFELRLIQNVGYRPQLFACVHCGGEIEPVENLFSAEGGGVVDPNCARQEKWRMAGHGQDLQAISVNALKVLRFLQTREYETVRTLKLGPAVLDEVERLLLGYLAHHLERNLKSVEFLHRLRQPVEPFLRVDGHVG